MSTDVSSVLFGSKLEISRKNTHKKEDKSFAKLLSSLKQGGDTISDANKEAINKYTQEKKKLASISLLQNYFLRGGEDIFGTKTQKQDDFFDVLNPFYGVDKMKPKKLNLMDILVMKQNQNIKKLENKAISKSLNKGLEKVFNNLVFDKNLKAAFEEKFGKDYQKEANNNPSKLLEYAKFLEKYAKENEDKKTNLNV